jgi:hypothetical protein
MAAPASTSIISIPHGRAAKWSDALGFHVRPPKLQDPLPGWLRNGLFFQFGISTWDWNLEHLEWNFQVGNRGWCDFSQNRGTTDITHSGSSTSGSASPGVAERVARAPMSVSFGFSRSGVDKKAASAKKSAALRLPSTVRTHYGGAGFQLLHKFL